MKKKPFFNDLLLIRKFIENTLKEGKESIKPPEPHMCLKTRLIVSF